MENEHQLASLVFLLRLPLDNHDAPTAGEADGAAKAINSSVAAQTTSSSTPVTSGSGKRRRRGDGNGSSALQAALERNDCKLMCFAGRIVRHYAQSADVGSMSVGYAYLRLATRIAFLRYATHSLAEIDGCDRSGNGGDRQKESCNVESNAGNNDRIWEHERCLGTALLAALRAGSSHEIGEVEVEMAWAVQSLLVRLSKMTIRINSEQNKKLSRLWTEMIDALVARRKEVAPSNHKAMTNEESSPASENLSEKKLMIKTIHSILDGNGSAKEINHDNDWNLQSYDISLVSCIQSFIQLYSDDIQQQTTTLDKKDYLPLWTKDALFEMVHWSQKNDSFSAEVFGIVLQYLHLCTLGVCSRGTRQANTCQFYSTSVARENTANKYPCAIDDAEEFSSVVRSYLFYGLVVLSNAVPSQNAADTEALPSAQRATHVSDGGMPTTASMRGDIYLLFLELWRLHGTDWLRLSASTAVPSTSRWWWFQTGEKRDDEHRIGPMWPLCTLVRLAAGEFRLGLGRWVTVVEDGGGEDSTEDCARLVSDISCCARIVTEAVGLMTTIAEDEGALATWHPDAILHIRKSLEDSLNASVQYFNAALDGMPLTHLLLEEREEVGRTCCLVMGSIAAELEVDHLLATPSNDIQPSDSQNQEKSISSFAYALHEGIMFCYSLGERQFPDANNGGHSFISPKQYVHDEPLTHLLTCIMSLVSNGTSDQEESISTAGDQLHFVFEALCKGDCLMLAISSLLCRSSRQWSNRFEGVMLPSQVDDSDTKQADSMISVLKLSTLIVKDFFMIENSPSQKGRLQTLCSQKVNHEVQHSLEVWKKNLTQIGDWPSQTLRSDAALALTQVLDCLEVLNC